MYLGAKLGLANKLGIAPSMGAIFGQLFPYSKIHTFIPLEVIRLDSKFTTVSVLFVRSTFSAKTWWEDKRIVIYSQKCLNILVNYTNDCMDIIYYILYIQKLQ